jgi:putative alpha-1,2-mannosidase
MGDTNGGNTFPGVSLPLGMVKIGPDLYTGSDSYSGYQPSGNFIGFSLLHESGTGGAPKYGVVAQMPVLGDVGNPLADLSVNRSKADETRLGYYKSSLFSGITVELGATGRAGMLKYEFPETGGAPNVVVDVSHVLSSYRGQGLGQNYLGGNITVTTTDGAIHYEGFGSYDNVCEYRGPSLRASRYVNCRIGVEPGPQVDGVFLWLLRSACHLQDILGERCNRPNPGRL